MYKRLKNVIVYQWILTRSYESLCLALIIILILKQVNSDKMWDIFTLHSTSAFPIFSLEWVYYLLHELPHVCASYMAWWRVLCRKRGIQTICLSTYYDISQICVTPNFIATCNKFKLHVMYDLDYCTTFKVNVVCLKKILLAYFMQFRALVWSLFICHNYK